MTGENGRNAGRRSEYKKIFYRRYYGEDYSSTWSSLFGPGVRPWDTDVLVSSILAVIPPGRPVRTGKVYRLVLRSLGLAPSEVDERVLASLRTSVSSALAGLISYGVLTVRGRGRSREVLLPYPMAALWAAEQ